MKEFKYKINGNSYTVTVTNVEDNTIEMEVNGTPCTVEMEGKSQKQTKSVKRPMAPAPTPTSIASTPVARPAATSGTKSSIKSPLPGIIMDVRCKEGDTVKKGQVLMILEAMKMENNILANADGKVTQVLVHKGDNILEGADLVVIE